MVSLTSLYEALYSSVVIYKTEFAHCLSLSRWLAQVISLCIEPVSVHVHTKEMLSARANVALALVYTPTIIIGQPLALHRAYAYIAACGWHTGMSSIAPVLCTVIHSL